MIQHGRWIFISNYSKLDSCLFEILFIDDWNILKFINGLIVYFKHRYITTNVYSVTEMLPIHLIDGHKAAASLICEHTGTSGFRGYDISLDEDRVAYRVYANSGTWDSSCFVQIIGFWK